MLTLDVTRETKVRNALQNCAAHRCRASSLTDNVPEQTDYRRPGSPEISLRPY